MCIRDSIKGTLLQCAVIGVGCGILFQVVGVPNAAVLGLITGVMNIIPIIGPCLLYTSRCV